MTDEERRKLCEGLRSCPEDAIEIIAWMRMAATEIERLATEVERLTTIMSGNVRLVEELDDGAIFEVGSPLPRGADSE